MSGTYALAAADYAKNQGFPASIVKLELRENGGTSDQWQSIGDITGGEMTAEGLFQTVSGGAKRQHGVMLSIKGSIVATGTNMRTALANIASTVTDVRATDINGHVRTFAQEVTGIRGDLVIGEAISASDTVDGDVLIPFEWTGYATLAKWLAMFATS